MSDTHLNHRLPSGAVQARLKRLGLSIGWLAERIGYSRNYLGQVLTGSKPATPELVATLAKALDCTVAELLAVDLPPSPAEIIESALERRVAEIVSQAPPLSDAQYGRLARLLGAHVRAPEKATASSAA